MMINDMFQQSFGFPSCPDVHETTDCQDSRTRTGEKKKNINDRGKKNTRYQYEYKSQFYLVKAVIVYTLCIYTDNQSFSMTTVRWPDKNGFGC